MAGLIRRFVGDRSGNFVVAASLAVVPLVLSVGFAVDLSSIAQHRAALQHAVDSAVLAIAREGKDVPQARAEAIAEQFLAGNFGGSVGEVTVVRDGMRYRLHVDSATDLAFGGMFGRPEWPIDAAATADIAYAAYEIGLVLDTTGSMAGGKLKSMKEAVAGLIDTMSAQVTDKNQLKFALVPFSSFVNVGPQYGPAFDATGKQIPGTGASWLDLQGVSPIPQVELPEGLSRFQLAHHIGQPWGGCVETRPINGTSNYAVDDTPARATDPKSLFVPVFAPDEEDLGYVNSYLVGDVKTLDNAGSGKPKKMKKYGVPVKGNGDILPYGQITLLSQNGLKKWTKFPPDFGLSGLGGYNKGPNFGCVTRPITPLTNDYAALKADVAQFAAAGNTNVMEGVAWGTRVLSPGEPFTQGQDPKTAGVQKMMIVLTDGSNTFGNTNNELGSIYSSFGYLVDGRLGITSGGTSATNSEMNKQTLAACKVAKDSGIQVYTIRLEEPNVTTGTMLKECASSPDFYFDVPTRAKLDEAFSAIRDKIVRVRISS